MPSDIESIKRRFGIIGQSPLLLQAIEVAHQVAPTDLSVLVLGESGTGKEFFPKIVHQYSARKHGQYVPVNCGAIPEGTIDSELFGHVKGSFTGAHESREGYFEVANGGTIFLDEVAELPLSTQARLLRVLESGEFMRVGSSQAQKTDIRLIAATNVNLDKAIAEGRFREDLYYRLSTVPIYVPPLRERGHDVILLFKRFANDFSEKYRMPALELSEEAEQELMRYNWPGNVRQLKNMTEQISIIETRRLVSADTIKKYLPQAHKSALPAIVKQPEHSYAEEREVLYHLLYELRNELNDMKGLVMDLLRKSGSAQTAQFEREHAHAIHNLTHSFDIPTEISVPIRRMRDAAKEYTEPEPILESENTEEEPTSLASLEEETIRRTLKRHAGHRKQTAAELGISERTLYRKIRSYNIEE